MLNTSFQQFLVYDSVFFIFSMSIMLAPHSINDLIHQRRAHHYLETTCHNFPEKADLKFEFVRH